MITVSIRTPFVTLLTIFSLTACGGGGGSGAPPPPANAAPIASGVSVTDDNGGDVIVGDGLTGAYSYSDAEGDAEGTSTFRWLRDGTVISGATVATYVVVPDDVSTAIVFQVIPVAASGTRTGNAANSSSITVANSTPTASSVSVTDDNGGDAVAGDILTGSYIFADIDGDTEGTSVFRWLRDGIEINGATAITYVLAPDDAPANVAFEVTPVAVSGVTNGNAVASNSITVLNTAPIANAGTDQLLVEGNTVVLSAAASTDFDGTIVSYLWNQTAGPAASIQDSTAATTTLATLLTDDQLTLMFEVTVTDDNNAMSTATTTITIDPSLPPAVNAGADIETIERETVALGGMASDTDGSVSTLAWAQTAGPTVVLTGSDTASPSFEAPLVANIAVLEFEFTATDNTNDQSTDVISITVNPNEAPELRVHFPCAGCRSYGSALSVTGEVTSGPDNAFVTGLDGVASVTVDAGAGSVVAIAETSGRWIAQNVPVPNAVDTVSFVVVANDLLGESSNSIINLSVEPTLTSVLVAHDPITPNIVYLYETNNPIERLFSVDTNTQSITRIHEASSLMRNVDQAGTALVEASGSRLILNDLAAGVVAFDLITGAFTVVSDAVNGTGPTIGRPSLMALDSDENRLVVYDDVQTTLFLVDLTSGDRTVVSNNTGTGAGILFNNPNAIAVDAANNFAFLHESGEVYLSVDLATGDRVVLPEIGDAIGASFSMDFDPMRSRLAVLNWVNDDVFTIDLPSGARTRISDEPAGSAFYVGNPRQITVDVLGDRYVINDYSANISGQDTDQLVSVAPDTGVRAAVFDDKLGSGAFLNGSVSLDIDLLNNVLFLASSLDDNLVRLDLATGARSVVSDATTGVGTAFGTIRDVAFDRDANRVLLIDAELASLLSVDLATGNRSVISGGLIGGGAAFSTPIALEPDYANGQVFVLDQTADSIVSVELTTGQRTTISGIASPGPLYMDAGGLTLDEANNRLLVTVEGLGATSEVSLQAVDLATGTRSSLSDFVLGNGPFLNSLRDVVLLDNSDFAIVSSISKYYRVNLLTGDRQILAEGAVANGESIINSPNMAYDPTINVIYTWSSNFEALFAIDVLTGDRVIVNK